MIPWEALVAAASASGAIPKRKSGAHAQRPQLAGEPAHPKRAREEGGGGPRAPLTPTSILRPQATGPPATTASKRHDTRVLMAGRL